MSNRRKKKTTKNQTKNMLYMLAAFVLTILFIFSGSYVNSSYNLSVNDISPARFTAPTDVVNRVATERLKTEAMNSVAPLYKHDSNIQDNALKNMDSFFDTLNLLYDENETIADTINFTRPIGVIGFKNNGTNHIV